MALPANRSHMMHIKFSAMTWFGILFVITAILAVAIPSTPAALHTLHVDSTSYHLLVASLLVPYGLIWFAGFIAYDSLDSYARTLGEAKEARAVKKIAWGIRILAWGLILSSILSLLLNGVSVWKPAFIGVQTIINHYAALAIAVVAFTYIGDGAYLLVQIVKVRRSLASMRILVLLTAVVGVLFTRFVAHNSNVNDNPYYLSVFPLLLTVVVPYIYAWVIGVIGTYELRLYAKHIKGVLYQQGLAYLANGLSVVIVVSVIVQFITAAFTRNPQVALGWVLLVIYSLLVL